MFFSPIFPSFQGNMVNIPFEIITAGSNNIFYPTHYYNLQCIILICHSSYHGNVLHEYALRRNICSVRCSVKNWLIFPYVRMSDLLCFTFVVFSSVPYSPILFLPTNKLRAILFKCYLDHTPCNTNLCLDVGNTYVWLHFFCAWCYLKRLKLCIRL